MTPLLQGDSVTIGRVQIRTRPSNASDVEHRVAGLLRNASFHPRRLSASSILFVRRLQDPFPGSLAFAPTRIYLPGEWESALSGELDRSIIHAARPARSAVPPSANSVLFLDPSELLASLAMDWIDGTASSKWWWFTLLKQSGVTGLILRKWAESPESAPAALELLARHSMAVEFVRRLPASFTADLLANVVRSHALPLERLKALPHNDPSLDAQPDHQVHRQTTESSPLALHPDPWLPWAPEASAGALSVEARRLLAFGLILRRAPTVARSQSFAQRIWAWSENVALHAVDRLMPRVPSNANSTPSELAGTKTRNTARPETPATRENPSPHPLETSQKTGQPKPRQTPPPAASDQSPRSNPITPSANIQRHSEAIPIGTPLEEPQPCHSAESAPQIQPFNEEPHRFTTPGTPPLVTPRIPLQHIETAFGGLFFLLNAAIHMGIYSDFSEPRDTGTDLSPWDFLALLGLEYWGLEFTKDALWQLLAELAGRHPDEPPPTDFRTPVNSPLPPSHAGQTWISWIADRSREAFANEQSIDELLRKQARVTQTATHIDVYFSLQAHPIEIRIAGLDRNPGWIPAAGRYVTFYFD